MAKLSSQELKIIQSFFDYSLLGGSMLSSELKPGDCLFYEQKPMMILYLISPGVFKVKPIFLEGEEYEQKFADTQVRLLHT